MPTACQVERHLDLGLFRVGTCTMKQYLPTYTCYTAWTTDALFFNNNRCLLQTRVMPCILLRHHMH